MSTHAAVVPQRTPGAALAAAGPAGKVQLQHACPAGVGEEPERLDGRAEERHHRRAHAGGHVHDPGVARDQRAAAGAGPRSPAVRTLLPHCAPDRGADSSQLRTQRRRRRLPPRSTTLESLARPGWLDQAFASAPAASAWWRGPRRGRSPPAAARCRPDAGQPLAALSARRRLQKELRRAPSGSTPRSPRPRSSAPAPAGDRDSGCAWRGSGARGPAGAWDSRDQRPGTSTRSARLRRLPCRSSRWVNRSALSSRPRCATDRPGSMPMTRSTFGLSLSSGTYACLVSTVTRAPVAVRIARAGAGWSGGCRRSS